MIISVHPLRYKDIQQLSTALIITVIITIIMNTPMRNVFLPFGAAFDFIYLLVHREYGIRFWKWTQKKTHQRKAYSQSLELWFLWTATETNKNQQQNEKKMCRAVNTALAFVVGFMFLLLFFEYFLYRVCLLTCLIEWHAAT